MINNNGKLFGKINIVDLGVILIIILAIVLSALRFTTPSLKNTGEKETFQYTLLVKGVRDFTVDAFKENDEMYETTSENSIGKIIEINKMPAKKYMADVNGTISYQELPDQYDLYLTLECDGNLSSKGYETTTGENIQINKSINAFNKYCKTTFVVKELKK